MLNIEGNRQRQEYTKKELLRRIAWGVGRVVFSLVPRPFHGVRASLLRLFGAKVGRNVHVYPSATIYFPWMLEIGDFSAVGEHAYIYSLGKVTIGERVTISQRAHLCAGSHDYQQADLPLLRPPITVGSDAWIAADAFVGPNTRVGQGAVVGARAVVFGDVEPWAVVVGNPAKVVKHRKLADQGARYD